LRRRYILSSLCIFEIRRARQTRWLIKAAGLNATQGGRMLVLRYQETMQMRKRRQRTAWELGCPRWTLHAHFSERVV
jgi:hypothetical protein